MSLSLPGSPCSTNTDNDTCSLGLVVGTPAFGLCPASAAPDDSQSFFSNYSTLCDWAGTGADSLNFNNYNNAKVGLPYGFPGGPDMMTDDHPFLLSFLLHSSAAAAVDLWSNGLSMQELLAVQPAQITELMREKLVQFGMTVVIRPTEPMYVYSHCR